MSDNAFSKGLKDGVSIIAKITLNRSVPTSQTTNQSKTNSLSESTNSMSSASVKSINNITTSSSSTHTLPIISVAVLLFVVVQVNRRKRKH